MLQKQDIEMSPHTLVILVLFVASFRAQTLEQQTCNVDRMFADHAMTGADVVIGFISELRGVSSTGTGCGEVDYEFVMSWEAARWTVNQLNTNNYVNGVKFGLRGYDTCGSTNRAVAALNHFYQQFSASSMYCNQTSQLNLGIVGTMSSVTTKAVAALSSKFPASVISPQASSPRLSDKSEYPYFLRTAFSATEQIKTMLAAMTTLQWERVIFIYTDNDYGRDSYNEFIKLSQDSQVCVVEAISVPSNPSMPAYIQSLKNVGTHDVQGAVFFGTHSASTMMLSVIENMPSAQNIQFMLSSFNKALPITNNRARGLLLVQRTYTEVSEFFDYWTTGINATNTPPENPWYMDWFMRTFQCRLQGVNYEPYVRYSDCDPKSPDQKRAASNTRFPFIDTTVKAVLTYANAFKKAHQQTCGSQPGMCLGLRQMSAEQFHNNYLKVADFNLNEFGITSLNGQRVKFDFNGEFYTAGHDIFNSNNQPAGGAFTFKKVGDFIDGKLNLNTSLMYFYNATRTAPLASIPTSRCPSNGCKNCLVPREMVHFNYKAGDVVLAGLFDLHAQGSEVLTCGSLKAVHALNAAAFTFAVEKVKQQFSILSGVNLGSLIIDLCDNAETGRILLNDLLAGRAIVSDVHGTVVDPNLVSTVVGELDSTEAMSMATMLSHFSMPYIESSATSVQLSDKDMYETFSRAIPSDYHQMMTIVLLLKKMNWNYVQVVHSPNAYGRTGYKTIRDEGAKRSICVATSHEIGTDGTHAAIVRNLNKKPEARIVIAIVDSYDYRVMLEALKDQNLVRRFILIGTETWGTRKSVTDGLQNAAEGSITLNIDGPNIQDFRTWLDSKNPSVMVTAMDMPFIVEWYQYAYSCYLDAQNKGVYTNQCNPNLPLTQATRYEESPYTPFLIIATYAAARAIDATLRDYCGDLNGNYNGICWRFRSNPDVPAKILEYLKSSQFTLGAYPFKMVDGEGKTSYSVYSFSGGQYIKIGIYRTESSQLDMSQDPASLPTGFSSVCTGFCSECVYLVQTEPFWSIPSNDLKLGVNFAAHDQGSEPFLCSGIRLTNGFQSYLAVQYAIEQVNTKRAPVSLNNVNLGALMLDHCNSPARAYGMPAALYSGIFDANLNTIRGWLTDNNLVTAEMKDFFSDLNLPVISTMGSSNKFLDGEEYPTFARTFQGDSTIASALAVFVKSMGFRYVSLVYSDDDFGRTGFEAFSDIAVQEGICVIKSIKMGNMTDDAMVADLVTLPSLVVVIYVGQGDMDKFLEARGRNPAAMNLLIISPEPYPMVLYKHGLSAKNVLSLRMKTNVLENYHNYLKSINAVEGHPMLREYYMALFICNLPGEYRYTASCGQLQNLTSSANFYQDNYVLPIINAVYSFVAAAHLTLREQCGDNYNGVCARFYADVNTNSILYDKMTKIGFSDDSRSTFGFIGKEGNTGREIALFDGTRMQTFAEFTGATIEGVNANTFKNVKSSCNPPCTQCLNTKMEFTYIPGDILLGGIFDVHESSLEAFSCGKINTLHGFQLLEAFHFAINKVNDKTDQFANILKNVKIGGVGLDACQSAVRSGFLVSNIFSGLTELYRNEQFVDPDKIDAIVGTYSSGSSIYVGRILKSLQLPQISYGSTSVTLTDQDRYPYFIRTVPADDLQVTGMVKFLREFDIRYVQIVHTSDNYGEQGAKTFKRIAAENKVCVAQTISFQDKSDITLQNADDIVFALLQKPVANTVVVFADSVYINELLQAVKRYPEAEKKFKFIGSDTWANNVESTKGVENIAAGAVTFDLDVEDIPEFDQYLYTKTPANYPENPWFGEYYEAIHNCYLTIPDARYPERCRGTQNIVTSPRYKQDTVIIHVINAVFAAAYGLDKALGEECGANYTTVCEKFKNRDMRRQFLLNKTKEVNFIDPSGSNFSFSERGDGKKGYIMYALETAQANTFAYSPIGRYSNERGLSVTSGYRPGWDGSCNRPDSCTECPAIRDLITRYMLPTTSSSNTDTLIFMTNIHSQGNDEYRCGKLDMIGILNALSFVYKLANTTRLRPLVLDSCDNPIRIDQDLLNVLARGQLCNEMLSINGQPVSKSNVVGVITTGSRYVVAANRVTAPNKITLLGTISSSIALSNKENYPYFARMVPPDKIQMEVIARILKSNGWSYVGVIYSKDSYGINGFRELKRIVNDGKYSCIGSAVGVGYADSPEEIRPAVRTIAEEDGINIVVLLAVNPTQILQAIKAENLDRRFVVIGTDTWGNALSVVEVFQEDTNKNFRGAVTVGFRDAFYDPFYNWLKTDFSMSNRLGLPDDWFEEFYQTIHECKLPNPKTAVRVSYGTKCLGTETMTLKTIEKLKSYGVGLGPIAATQTMMSAYDEFKRHYKCSEKTTWAICNVSEANARVNLFQQTLNTTWSIPLGDLSTKENFFVELGEDRYWNVGYNIHTLTIDGNKYMYRNIGSQTNDVFTFNKTSYAMEGTTGVASACPEGKICDCVVDDKPQAERQVKPKYMRDHEPRNYFMYDEDTNKKVLEWPVWAIAVAVLTCIGLLVGILLFTYFLIFYPVRGGTTFLGFLVMLGILCIYAINFAFFYPASKDTCGIREFLMGVVYAIALAPLLVKAVDNWRFKDTEYSPDRYVGLTSPVSLVLIAIGIILVQCIIPIEWLILKPPSASLMEDSTLQHDWMWCDPHDFYDISIMLSMVLIIFLVLLTAIFSALSWDSESNYFESRWIFVSCVCTAGCFLVWMIVSTSAGPPYRDPAVAIGNLLNATALLICNPFRKLILLIQFSSEEEKAKRLPADDNNAELYSTVFNNQVYQPDEKVPSENGYQI